MKIIYFPLESYEERYTAQLSGEDGWMDRNFRKEGVAVYKMKGQVLEGPISSGVALDGCGRGHWALTQVANFLSVLKTQPNFYKDAVLYFDDFWHPGMEAIPYAYNVMGLPFPRMFAFAWAQSVDEYDFTVNMLPWYRYFEKANAEILEGIFVSTPMMKPLFVNGGIGNNKSVHVVGHPYLSESVREFKKPNMEDDFDELVKQKKNKVIYASRWDREKRPEKFLKMLDKWAEKETEDFKQTEFVITTSSPVLRSNEPVLLYTLRTYLDKYENLTLKEGLSKAEYYQELIESKVHVNTGDQDWISWTLLECLTFGCVPVYPDHRSFQEVLPKVFRFGDVEESFEKTMYFKNSYTQTIMVYKEDFIDLYKQFDTSVHRICQIMKGEWYDSIY